MEKLEFSLPTITVPKTKTNPIYVLAEEVAAATHTTPTRWLRECKKYEWEVRAALRDLKMAPAKKPIALFTFLLKKYKHANNQPN